MNDGRDHWGRPVFANGLGVGNPHRRGAQDLHRGVEVLDYTPTDLDEQRQPAPPMTNLSRRAAPTLASEDAPAAARS
jgi:hypothetical protein